MKPWRATRMKLLVHHGIGIWLANRRLNQGRFTWQRERASVQLSRPRFDALVPGLPRQRIDEAGVIRMLWVEPRSNPWISQWQQAARAGMMPRMLDVAQLPTLSETQLRALAHTLIEQVNSQQRELDWRQAKIDKLTHELAVHKRWRFGVRTERPSAEQAKLFEETVEAGLAAIERELEQLSSAAKPADKAQPRRLPLPAHLPRREIRHEPDRRGIRPRTTGRRNSRGSSRCHDSVKDHRLVTELAIKLKVLATFSLH